MELRFEGCSDDTFGEYESINDDWDNCASGNPIQWVVIAPNGDSLIVVGQYCPGVATGWLIGVARADEDDDKPLPDWPIYFKRGEREYSPALIIDAPKGCIMKHINNTLQNTSKIQAKESL